MKKCVFALFMAAAGFSPAFANDAVAVQSEPKKADETAVTPATPQEKKESGAILCAAVCNSCPTSEKKEATKEEQKTLPEQQKPESI